MPGDHERGVRRGLLSRIIEGLKRRGAEAVILGCTEIGMLLTKRRTASLALYDTTKLHAARAVAFALGR